MKGPRRGRLAPGEAPSAQPGRSAGARAPRAQTLSPGRGPPRGPPGCQGRGERRDPGFIFFSLVGGFVWACADIHFSEGTSVGRRRAAKEKLSYRKGW
ncbi:unnamed protein product [Rangifer tarandus platyrhynchus]|uniref:Uncharacterized protein n=1 Tax=Rangifer tarandus platyrhynchus TaxID=3082113 RepID=A0AC60A6C2_RANTA